MTQVSCTVRRVGDHESRTEEYEVAYAVGQAPPRVLLIQYQAARAYEINAALDAAVEAAKAAISDAGLIQNGNARFAAILLIVVIVAAAAMIVHTIIRVTKKKL